MEDLKLEKNESILLITTEAWRYFDDNELAVDTLYLTNQNLISVYEKSKGIFSKRETVIDKVPLTSISIINDAVQVKKVIDDDYGESLQIIFDDGKKELLEFTESPKKEYQQWKVAIYNAVLECNGKRNTDNQDETIVQNSPAAENNETVNLNTKGKRFCSFCGTKLDPGARFCKNCGKSIEQTPPLVPPRANLDAVENKSIMTKPLTERKIVYEGKIHKCPNCGENLKSFITNCPSCGHEMRDGISISSVQEFAMKLENIENKKIPFPEKISIMKTLIGRDLKKEDEDENERELFENQKNQEKATLIINFPIPNTREDIMEFMLLVASNIDARHNIDDVVSKAWITKLEQVYQKAKISMEAGTDFEQIRHIYFEKKKQITDRKVRVFLLGAGCVLIWFFLMGLLWNPYATIAIVIVVVILALTGYLLFKKKYIPRG